MMHPYLIIGDLPSLVWVVFGLWVLLALSKRRRRRQTPRPSRIRKRALRKRKARLTAARPTAAAQRAMSRAGYGGGEAYASVTDVGLLAYRHAQADPRVVREQGVMLDTRYLRPFAKLWLPRAAHGHVRFEILDADGHLRYADEARYFLHRGDNSLFPNAWLPLKEQGNVAERWTLRVLVSGMLLAEHVFGWQEVGASPLQPYIAADGEISPMLWQMAQEEAEQGVSLSELLAE